MEVDLLNEYNLRNPFDKLCNDVKILSFSAPELVKVADGTFKLEVGTGTPAGLITADMELQVKYQYGGT